MERCLIKPLSTPPFSNPPSKLLPAGPQWRKPIFSSWPQASTALPPAASGAGQAQAGRFTRTSRPLRYAQGAASCPPALSSPDECAQLGEQNPPTAPYWIKAQFFFEGSSKTSYSPSSSSRQSSMKTAWLSSARSPAISSQAPTSLKILSGPRRLPGLPPVSRVPAGQNYYRYLVLAENSFGLTLAYWDGPSRPAQVRAFAHRAGLEPPRVGALLAATRIMVLVNGGKLLVDLGQFCTDDLPHDVEVDTKVVVDQTIAGSGHALPRNATMSSPQLLGQIFRRFAQDL